MEDGPAYEDRAGRRAIRICDLIDEKTFRGRVENLLEYHNLLRSSLGAALKNVDEILVELAPIRSKILELAKPAFEIAQKLSTKSVMFEGAQGALLDVTYGTFPFVTSSNTMIKTAT